MVFSAVYNKSANRMSLIQIFNLAAYVVKGFLARPHDVIFIMRLQRAGHLLFVGEGGGEVASAS